MTTAKKDEMARRSEDDAGKWATFISLAEMNAAQAGHAQPRSSVTLLEIGAGAEGGRGVGGNGFFTKLFCLDMP